MLIYKGKKLTKTQDKSGGKNHDPMDGFYQNSDGEEFFIKKPRDRKELFTEWFAGALLEELKRRGLIAEVYYDSLICADLIQFEEGSYGLIQPRAYFTELYKVIGTSHYWNGSDRDPLIEMFLGPRYYSLLTQKDHYFGLAVALMLSLLLADYSVHSGNMVCLDVISVAEVAFTRFARIDWGAAFRYFGHKDNNSNLLHPFEYQGWLNPKGYTKGYFLNYKLIPGLFLAIAEQAKLLKSQLNDVLLSDIVATVLKKVPEDLIDEITKKELAQYLYMDSFKTIDFSGKNYDQFLPDFINLLNERLKKITELQEVYPVENNSSSSLFTEHAPVLLQLQTQANRSFPEQLKAWQESLNFSEEKTYCDFNAIKLETLIKQFNCFIEDLLKQFEGSNLSNSEFHDLDSGQEALSSELRQLFTLESDGKPLHFSKEELFHDRINGINEPHLKPLVSVLTLGFNIVMTLRVIRETQNSRGSSIMSQAAAVHLLFNGLKEYLDSFQKSFHNISNTIIPAVNNATSNPLPGLSIYLGPADGKSNPMMSSLSGPIYPSTDQPVTNFNNQHGFFNGNGTQTNNRSQQTGNQFPGGNTHNHT